MPKKRAIVFGASGMVGNAIFKRLDKKRSAGFDLEPADNAVRRLDVRELSALQSAITENSPEIIYWLAANPNVEAVEQDPEASWFINVESIKKTADIINSTGLKAKFVYFSSDYIFDGVNGPYSEDSLPHPINIYGLEKLIAEHIVMREFKNFLIIRTTVVYGPEYRRKNFLYQALARLKKNEPLKVPQDQIGSPTFSEDLAENAIRVGQSSYSGILNIAGDNLVSRYEFALEIARCFGFKEGLIIPVKTADLKQKAKRPLNAGLRLDLLKSLKNGVPMRGYQEALRFIRQNYDEEFK